METMMFSQLQNQTMILMNQEYFQALQSQPVTIGGDIHINIASFETISHLCPPDMNLNRGQLTEFEYSSMFFQNMGYTSAPDNPTNWMKNGITVENVPRRAPISYIPNERLTFNQDRTSLRRLLNCISVWGRGGIETGYVVNEKDSYDPPDAAQVKHCLSNNIMLKRPIVIDSEKRFWAVHDIISRRAHNVCPHIDPEYSYNCIRKFTGYLDQIQVNEPWVLFIAALIDPNLVFSIIKKCEMSAAQGLNRYYYGYPSLRSDYHTALFFQNKLNDSIMELKEIYKKKGAKGFLDLVRVNSPSRSGHVIVPNPVAALEVMDPESQTQSTPPNYDEVVDRVAELQTAEERADLINKIPLTDKNIKMIFNHIEKESLPEYLTEPITDINGNATYGEQYGIALTRMYIMLNCLKKDNPVYLDSDCKWIVSKPFFISENAFALYNQKFNKTIIAYPNFTWTITDPYEALRLYKERYDKQVLLDPDELGDSVESKAVVETVLKTDIPVGEENNYIKPDISANLEVEVPDETPEEDVPLTKEEMARILSEKYNVRM